MATLLVRSETAKPSSPREMAEWSGAKYNSTGRTTKRTSHVAAAIANGEMPSSLGDLAARRYAATPVATTPTRTLPTASANAADDPCGIRPVASSADTTPAAATPAAGTISRDPAAGGTA